MICDWVHKKCIERQKESNFVERTNKRIENHIKFCVSLFFLLSSLSKEKSIIEINVNFSFFSRTCFCVHRNKPKKVHQISTWYAKFMQIKLNR